jgi:hypothetical protein
MQKTTDWELAGRLIAGWLDGNGKHQYLKPGSKEEREARRAMTRVLRSDEPLPWEVRSWLAMLFDPDTIAPTIRDIKFYFRHKGGGGPPQFLQHHQIGLQMLRLVRGGNTVDAAVKVMMGKYKLADRQVRKIWARHGKPRLHSSS